MKKKEIDLYFLILMHVVEIFLQIKSVIDQLCHENCGRKIDE